MSSPALRNDNIPGESFAKFFESWIAQQNGDLHSLLSASASPRPCTLEEEAALDLCLRPLVTTVLGHYEHYYRVKKASARREVLRMFTPTWTSSTENLFLWVGGWRPTMAFHLLYSKCGIQVEFHLEELVRGASTWDLADVDAEQLRRIDEIYRVTVRREREISEEEAAAQEMVADEQIVRLSHVITEMGDGDDWSEMMEAEMKEKVEAMGRVLEKADCLRIETLKGLVEILRPMQAVHFLIAAAELHLRVHEFGMRKDAAEETPAPAAL